jgi:hypothetical protein
MHSEKKLPDIFLPDFFPLFSTSGNLWSTRQPSLPPPLDSITLTWINDEDTGGGFFRPGTEEKKYKIKP